MPHSGSGVASLDQVDVLGRHRLCTGGTCSYLPKDPLGTRAGYPVGKAATPRPRVALARREVKPMVWVSEIAAGVTVALLLLLTARGQPLYLLLFGGLALIVLILRPDAPPAAWLIAGGAALAATGTGLCLLGR